MTTGSDGSTTGPAAPDPGAPRLTHPGPAAAERVVAVETRLTAHDVELPAGLPLLAALEQLLAETGGRSGCGQLVGGELAGFSYYVPALGPPGGPVATFSDPRSGAAPGRLVRGGLTLGLKEGAVFSHSHALFVDANGVRGAGHLIPESVVLGAGVRAQLSIATDVQIEVLPDPETEMSLFTPRRIADTGRGEVAGMVCRIRPNVDLVNVIEFLADEQGWAGANVCGQIGSLIGGRLGQPDGSVVEVDGPATEVMFLDGSVRREDGRMRAHLQAHLVDRHGIVHSGRLVPGHNPVAMTYELMLTEAAR
ncbi:DUF296 domain-containing protein [Streptomyces antimycoticus]|uniref:PCC domain-containing protein n=1 Tax=Streptomyces antimycoticus TaxID=68175 RepID=UPI0034339218